MSTGGRVTAARLFCEKKLKGGVSVATILEMRNITKTFPGVKALDNVNLKVEEGEIHALVGENGAGKSTLMNVLSGIYPYGSYEGDIIYQGEICKFKVIKDSEAKGIVIITKNWLWYLIYRLEKICIWAMKEANHFILTGMKHTAKRMHC